MSKTETKVIAIIVDKLGVDAKGEKAYYFTTKTPIYDKDGKVKGIIGTSIDITLQKEAEAREKAALADAVAARKEVEAMEKQVKENPSARVAQRALASEVTKIVHGEKRTESVEKVTAVLFGAAPVKDLSAEEIDMLAEEIPHSKIGKKLVDVLTESGVASSNGDARRLIESGGISVNGEKAAADATVSELSLIKKGKKQLADEVHRIGTLANFAFVRQKEPLGTGDALLQVRHLIGNEPVAVFYGDDMVVSDKPCLAQLIEVYDRYNAPVMALERVPKKEVSRYGVIDGASVDKRIYKVQALVEKPSVEDAPSNLIRIGRAIFTPKLFELLATIKRPKKGEFYDVYALDHFAKHGGDLYGYEYEGVRYDCGEKLGFLKATVQAGLNHAEVGKEFAEYLRKIRP